MAVSSNSNGFNVPAGYVLVPQTSLGPNTASNSNPKPAYGKN